jgi:cytochrome P450
MSTPAPLLSPAFLQDPYPTYRLHLAGPPIQPFPMLPGVFGVFGYEHCVWLLRNAPLSSSMRVASFFPAAEYQRGDYQDLHDHLKSWLLMTDAPEHTRLRKLMNPGFTPVASEKLRPQVEDIVGQLLADIEKVPDPDLLRDLAYPLPARVICRLLGVSESLQARCVVLSDQVATWFGHPLRTVEGTARAQEAARELVEIFRVTIAERRAGQDDDLMGLLLAATRGEHGMSDEVFYAQCVMMLFAGHETTRNLIGNGLLTLLRNPGALAELRADSSLGRAAIEEILRFETPVQGFRRSVLEDLDYQGIRVPAGAGLIFVIGAAHRDPGQFADPDRFDIHRPHTRHLAFGGDAHACLGATLARLEGQVAIGEVVRRYPGLGLADQAADWGLNFGLRGLKSLRVSL